MFQSKYKSSQTLLRKQEVCFAFSGSSMNLVFIFATRLFSSVSSLKILTKLGAYKTTVCLQIKLAFKQLYLKTCYLDNGKLTLFVK